MLGMLLWQPCAHREALCPLPPHLTPVTTSVLSLPPQSNSTSLPQDDHKLSLDELGRKYQVDLSKVSGTQEVREPYTTRWESHKTKMQYSLQVRETV
jgi:hypothetical protein